VNRRGLVDGAGHSFSFAQLTNSSTKKNSAIPVGRLERVSLFYLDWYYGFTEIDWRCLFDHEL